MIPPWLRMTLLLVLVSSVSAQGPEQPEHAQDPEQPEQWPVAGNATERANRTAPLKLKMKYEIDDWEPHFGYNPAHWAINHRHREPKTQTQDPTSALNIYLVRLVQNCDIFCGGIVVSINTVITAAKCVRNRKLANIVVKLSTGGTYRVLKHLPGVDYTRRTDAARLALLKLAGKLDKFFSKAPPICVNPLQSDVNVEVWSWGYKQKQPVKKVAGQQKTDYCRQEFNNTQGEPVGPDNLCVVNGRPTSECEETYGLPLLYNGRFCGINASGHNCPITYGFDHYVALFREKRYISRAVQNLVNKDEEEQFV